MKTAGTVSRKRDRAFGYLGDAVAIDVFHGEDMNARFANPGLLFLVQVADADKHGVGRQHGWRRADRRQLGGLVPQQRRERHAVHVAAAGDRKSTRLNSSHSQISYAVFCLKKKKKK